MSKVVDPSLFYMLRYGVQQRVGNFFIFRSRHKQNAAVVPPEILHPSLPVSAHIPSLCPIGLYYQTCVTSLELKNINRSPSAFYRCGYKRHSLCNDSSSTKTSFLLTPSVSSLFFECVNTGLILDGDRQNDNMLFRNVMKNE